MRVFHLSVVVHVKRDERVVAPVDKSHARPVHADVQLFDGGDDRLLDDVEAHAVDAARAVQHKHQVQQSAAVCNRCTPTNDELFSTSTYRQRTVTIHRVQEKWYILFLNITLQLQAWFSYNFQ